MMDKYVNTYWYNYNGYKSFIIDLLYIYTLKFI